MRGAAINGNYVLTTKQRHARPVYKNTEMDFWCYSDAKHRFHFGSLPSADAGDEDHSHCYSEQSNLQEATDGRLTD